LGYAVGAGGTMLRYSPTVGIKPGKHRKGRLNANIDIPGIDARGKSVKDKPCRTCVLDSKSVSGSIGR
jgi:hypothetical protein